MGRSRPKSGSRRHSAAIKAGTTKARAGADQTARRMHANTMEHERQGNVTRFRLGGGTAIPARNFSRASAFTLENSGLGARASADNREEAVKKFGKRI
jgi:hypothetical protein